MSIPYITACGIAMTFNIFLKHLHWKHLDSCLPWEAFTSSLRWKIVKFFLVYMIENIDKAMTENVGKTTTENVDKTVIKHVDKTMIESVKKPWLKT